MALQQEVRPPSAGLRRALGSADLLGAARPALAQHRRAIPARDVRGPQARRGSTSSPGGCRQAYPQTNGPRAFHAVALGEGPGVRASTRPLLYLLTVSVGLVLLIACANVTSLLRGALGVTAPRDGGASCGRREPRETGPPVADRVRCCSRSSAACAGWPVLASGARRSCTLPASPEIVSLESTARVLLFTFAVAAASGMLSGLAPVLHTLRSDTISALRDEGGAVATGVRAARWRRAFVVFQVAVSLMLLVGAGLVPAHAAENLRDRAGLPGAIRRWWRTSIWMCAATASRPAPSSTGRSSIGCKAIPASPRPARPASPC